MFLRSEHLTCGCICRALRRRAEVLIQSNDVLRLLDNMKCYGLEIDWAFAAQAVSTNSTIKNQIAYCLAQVGREECTIHPIKHLLWTSSGSSCNSEASSDCDESSGRSHSSDYSSSHRSSNDCDSFGFPNSRSSSMSSSFGHASCSRIVPLFSRPRALAHFSSVDSAILHSEVFLMRIFHNHQSSILPLRPLQECSYFGTVNNRGQRTGHGIYFYDDGSVFEGQWKDNVRCDGEGKCWYADGCYYTGEFRNNQREGSGVYNYFGSLSGMPASADCGFMCNNIEFEGLWKNDARCNGLGTCRFANGSSYTGEFCNNKREGRGTHEYEDGCVYSGEFQNNMRSGYGV
jgi:hypothetical protein